MLFQYSLTTLTPKNKPKIPKSSLAAIHLLLGPQLIRTLFLARPELIRKMKNRPQLTDTV